MHSMRPQVRHHRGKRSGGKFELNPEVIIKYEDDPELLDRLTRFMLFVITLAGKSVEEVQKLEEIELDRL